MMAMPFAIIMPPPTPWMPRKMMSCSIALLSPSRENSELKMGSPAAPESAEPSRNSEMPPM